MTIGENYFEDLATDLQTLELEDPSTTLPTNYKTLHELVTNISNKLHLDTNPYRLEWSDLCTDMGRRLLDLSGLECNPDIPACRSAESYFVKSLQPSNLRSQQHKDRSPIILTDRDTPVAFIKDLGAPTAYALRDTPDCDISEGCIYDLQIGAGYLPDVINGVWRVDIDKVTSVMPARLSTFIVPLAIRRSLLRQTPTKWEKRALNGEHETIAKLAENALAAATPL